MARTNPLGGVAVPQLSVRPRKSELDSLRPPLVAARSRVDVSPRFQSPSPSPLDAAISLPGGDYFIGRVAPSLPTAGGLVEIVTLADDVTAALAAALQDAAPAWRSLSSDDQARKDLESLRPPSRSYPGSRVASPVSCSGGEPSVFVPFHVFKNHNQSANAGRLCVDSDDDADSVASEPEGSHAGGGGESDGGPPPAFPSLRLTSGRSAALSHEGAKRAAAAERFTDLVVSDPTCMQRALGDEPGDHVDPWLLGQYREHIAGWSPGWVTQCGNEGPCASRRPPGRPTRDLPRMSFHMTCAALSPRVPSRDPRPP